MAFLLKLGLCQYHAMGESGLAHKIINFISKLFNKEFRPSLIILQTLEPQV